MLVGRLRRRRNITLTSAMAARRQTPPATPTPIPALAPVVREGEDVCVGLLDAVVLLVVVVEEVDEVDEVEEVEEE